MVKETFINKMMAEFQISEIKVDSTNGESSLFFLTPNCFCFQKTLKIEIEVIE